MIGECIMKNTGIRFKEEYLRELGFNLDYYVNPQGLPLLTKPISNHFSDTNQSATKSDVDEPTLSSDSPPTGSLFNRLFASASNMLSKVVPAVLLDVFAPSQSKSLVGHYGSVVLKHTADHFDACADIYDQLRTKMHWWFLEFIPMLSTFQNQDGVWMRHRM
jgi:hypothetical protein